MQVAIVIYPGLTALDALGPYEILKLMPDTEIRFVHHRVEPIVADGGALTIGATHTFDETASPDIVLVPGSTANTTTAMADSRLLSWLKRVHPNTRLTLSVCSGSLILAAAGLLSGHPATTHWIAQRALSGFDVTPQPQERIVKSGKLMTAAGVSAGLDLALMVVDELYGQETAEVIQLIIEYDPDPHLSSGHPSKASKEVRAIAKKNMLEAAKNPRDVLSVPIILWRGALAKVRRRMGFAS